MRPNDDAMMLVRSDLCDRVDRLRARSPRMTAADFVRGMAAIRGLAAAHGMVPVVRLAEALERAVAVSGNDLRRAPLALYLARLSDAIGCERIDEGASEAILASVSVRL